MNKEKVAEKSSGKNEWEEKLSGVEFRGVEKDRTADEILKRRERNFGKLTVEAAERGKVEPVEHEKTATEKLDEYTAESEWKEPEVKEFLVGQEKGIDATKMVVYPISAEKRAAVPREKAVWSFMNQVNKAETAEDFRAANILAQTIARDKSFDAEERGQITEFMKNPAYLMKKAGFEVENVGRALEADRGALALSKQRYAESQKGGFFQRFLNRRSIAEEKERVETIEKRVRDGEAALRKAEKTLAQYMPNAA